MLKMVAIRGSYGHLKAVPAEIACFGMGSADNIILVQQPIIGISWVTLSPS
jgi:hypothetical protein